MLNYHFGDNHMNLGNSSQRQSALLEYLMGALGRMLHQHDHLGRRSNEIHGPSHALHHLSRDDPVSDVSLSIHLHGAKHGYVQMPASDHGETLAARKKTSPLKLA